MYEHIITATGHRSDKLGGYGNTAQVKVREFAYGALETFVAHNCMGPVVIRSGMALGWDQAVAFAAVKLGIPFDAYIPFVGQEAKWPIPAQRIYKELLNQARSIVVVSAGGYEEWKMSKRNEAMVDGCTEVLALWNGSSGGTSNCIEYAKAHGVHVTNVWEWWIGNDGEGEGAKAWVAKR